MPAPSRGGHPQGDGRAAANEPPETSRLYEHSHVLGRRSPTCFTLLRTARVLGVPLRDLAG
ncbi:hypothetical protein ABZ023_07090 [Streptomyces sp. NPDC006367]|uniref:hypothetical protein n=1 Tax=unclassified Streptomyces TaxID=2593676 RepID=UPI0033BF0907